MPKDKVEPNKNDRKKLDKTKEAVKKYWKPFTVGVCTTTVIVVTIYVTKGRVKTAPIDQIVQNMNSLFGPWFSKQSMVLVNYTGTRGNPGFLTYWVEGNQVFENASIAAQVTGVPYYAVTEHLRGLRPDAFGQHFARVLGH